MDILYRNYKPGDETQLAALHNLCFSISFRRTPELVLWRYVNRPDFDPKEIHIAVDERRNRIVGVVYSTINRHIFNGIIEKTGSINDVGVDPRYGGHGIGRKLMQNAVDFMEEIGCTKSVLCADSHGFPRSKIYVPLGYEDYFQQEMWFTIGSPFGLFKSLPLAMPLVPVYAYRALSSLIQLTKWLKKNSEISFQVLSLSDSALKLDIIYDQWMEYRQTHKGYDGYFPSKSRWIYSRTPPNQEFQPSFVVLKDKKTSSLLGLATIMIQYTHLGKIGLKASIGFIRDFFIASEHPSFNTLLRILMYGVQKISILRGLAGIVYSTGPHEYKINEIFRASGYLKMDASVYMVKNFQKTTLQSPRGLFLVSVGDYGGYT